MNGGFNIVQGDGKCQMVVIVPGHCFFDQGIRSISDQIVIETVAQRTQVTQDTELNTTNVALFE